MDKAFLILITSALFESFRPIDSEKTMAKMKTRLSLELYAEKGNIKVQKVASALVNLKGITRNSKVPYLVTQVLLGSLPSAIQTW